MSSVKLVKKKFLEKVIITERSFYRRGLSGNIIYKKLYIDIFYMIEYFLYESRNLFIKVEEILSLVEGLFFAM